MSKLRVQGVQQGCCKKLAHTQDLAGLCSESGGFRGILCSSGVSTSALRCRFWSAGKAARTIKDWQSWVLALS